MARPGLWIAMMSLTAWSSVVADAQRPDRTPTPGQETRTPPSGIVRGRVQAVYGSRLFTVENGIAPDRDVLVLAPDPRATPAPGATAEAHGVFRRLEQADLEEMRGRQEVDASAQKLVGRRVLVAMSLMSVTRGKPAQSAAEDMPRQPARPSPLDAPRRTRSAGIATMLVRPATLADQIEDLAGHPVKVPYARVVGVLDARAFLIEPASSLPPAVGNRDRVLVLVDGGSVRVDAASLVSSIVTVAGMARTLLGAQVSAEVPWPAALDREAVERLEVRAAILATSVHTADGVELTDRLPTPASASPAYIRVERGGPPPR